MERFLYIWKGIVGPVYGYEKNGNTQWYYALSLGIDIMLAWMWYRDVAPVFTLLCALHFLTTYVYGLGRFEFLDIQFHSCCHGLVYLFSHLMIIAIAFIISWEASIRFMGITIIFVLIAPDYCGDTIITKPI